MGFCPFDREGQRGREGTRESVKDIDLTETRIPSNKGMGGVAGKDRPSDNERIRNRPDVLGRDVVADDAAAALQATGGADPWSRSGSFKEVEGDPSSKSRSRSDLGSAIESGVNREGRSKTARGLNLSHEDATGSAGEEGSVGLGTQAHRDILCESLSQVSASLRGLTPMPFFV